MNLSEQLETRYWALAKVYYARRDVLIDTPDKLKNDLQAVDAVKQFKDFFAGIPTQRDREEFFHNLASSGFTEVVKETIKYVSDQEKLFRAYVVAIGHEQKETVQFFLEGGYIKQANIDKSLDFICDGGLNVVLPTVFAFVSDSSVIAAARETARNRRSPRSLNLLDELIATRANNLLGLPSIYETPTAEPSRP